MRTLIFSMPVVALAACSGGSAPIEPGYWETTTTMSAGQREMWSSSVERCISEPEAAEPGAAILSTSPLGNCQAQENHYSGGSLTVRALCMGRGGAVAGDMGENRVTLEGRYTGTQIDARFTAQAIHEPENPPTTGTVTARRTRDCAT